MAATKTAAKKKPAKKQAAKSVTKVKQQPKERTRQHPFGTCVPLGECEHWI